MATWVVKYLFALCPSLRNKDEEIIFAQGICYLDYLALGRGRGLVSGFLLFSMDAPFHSVICYSNDFESEYFHR